MHDARVNNACTIEAAANKALNKLVEDIHTNRPGLKLAEQSRRLAAARQAMRFPSRRPREHGPPQQLAHVTTSRGLPPVAPASSRYLTDAVDGADGKANDSDRASALGVRQSALRSGGVLSGLRSASASRLATSMRGSPLAGSSSSLTSSWRGSTRSQLALPNAGIMGGDAYLVRLPRGVCDAAGMQVSHQHCCCCARHWICWTSLRNTFTSGWTCLSWRCWS